MRACAHAREILLLLLISQFRMLSNWPESKSTRLAAFLKRGKKPLARTSRPRMFWRGIFIENRKISIYPRDVNCDRRMSLPTWKRANALKKNFTPRPASIWPSRPRATKTMRLSPSPRRLPPCIGRWKHISRPSLRSALRPWTPCAQNYLPLPAACWPAASQQTTWMTCSCT